MSSAIRKTVDHWKHLFPFAHVPLNEDEYEDQLSFVDKLMDFSSHNRDDKRITALLKLVANNIRTYEEKKYTTVKVTSIEMLKFLMEEHGLGQSDLPEIGSQSLVSRILNNERQLTKEHIEKLSRRFHVSPVVFFG